MQIYAKVQKLEIGEYVELFELDLRPLGGDLLLFHGYTRVGPITWRGQVYEPWPISVTGIGRSSEAKQATPTLSVGNIAESAEGDPIIGVIGALCLQYQDLVGVRMTMRSTLAEYLPAINFPSKEYALVLARYQGVQLPADPTFAISRGDWTMSAKVIPREHRNGAWQHFVGGQAGAVAFGINGGQLLATLAGVTDAPGSGVAIPINVESQIDVVFYQLTRTIVYYVNGNEVSRRTWDYIDYATPGLLSNLIGRSGAYDGSYNGKIRNVRIYDKALSGTQVATSYTTGAQFGPIAAYDCNEREGRVLHDSVGQRHGQLLDGGYFEPMSYSNPDEDETQALPDEVWLIEQRTLEIPEQVDFELSSPLSFDGKVVPDRPITANMCTWKWKGGYRGPHCNYTGSAMYNKDGVTVTDPAQDKCPGTLQACQLRFGDQPLNFGGYPASDEIRGY